MNASPETREIIMQGESLVRHYKGGGPFWSRRPGFTALDHVDIEVHAGEIVGVVGESGSGKSTLAKLLLGLEPPTSGRVELTGREIGGMVRKDIARIVQPVFQDPYSSLNPSHTIERIVGLPLRMRAPRTSRRVIRDQVTELLDQVGLPSRVLSAYPRALSGGQRQRVSIARALAAKPRLLVCDEPTSALDVSVQAQILNLLLGLQRDLGLGMVLISHNLSVVGHMAERLYVMQNGRIVESGDTQQVFDHPADPYTQKLFASVLTIPF